jgi:hypothetical protein
MKAPTSRTRVPSSSRRAAAPALSPRQSPRAEDLSVRDIANEPGTLNYDVGASEWTDNRKPGARTFSVVDSGRRYLEERSMKHCVRALLMLLVVASPSAAQGCRRNGRS